ncbi:ASCH domain-containing protein [Nakamurella silvestris]|nr:ASCH domain-containing protein [Nakamurella silvestris]
MAWPRIDGLRVMELGFPGPLRQELNALTLAGTKRATAGLLTADYLEEDEELEHPGEVLVLVDDLGGSIGRIRVVNVEVVPFGEVSDDFARAEGEGFTGHDDWAVAHRRFWSGAGQQVDEQTSVVCVRYVLARSS